MVEQWADEWGAVKVDLKAALKDAQMACLLVVQKVGRRVHMMGANWAKKLGFEKAGPLEDQLAALSVEQLVGAMALWMADVLEAMWVERLVGVKDWMMVG